MKIIKKRILSLVLVLSLIMGCFMAIGTVDVQAASKNYMQNLKLKELKVNKKYQIKTPVTCTNTKQTSKYYITDLKKTDAKKKGYKKLTFTILIESSNVKQSKSSIHKLVNTYDSSGSNWRGYYAIVDSATGKELYEENEFDVTYTSSDWKYKHYPKQKDSDDCWVRYTEKTKATVTVVYPKTYKDLGILIGMYNSKEVKDGKTENAFWNGKKAFGATSYYKKAKNNCYYKKIK